MIVGVKSGALAYVGAIVAALACAAVLDALGLGWLRSHGLGVLIATALGGAQALVWGRDAVRARAALGAVVAGATAFILARAPLGWLDLGAIVAGPPGELPLLVLPAVSVLAVVVARRRAASGS